MHPPNSPGEPGAGEAANASGAAPAAAEPAEADDDLDTMKAACKARGIKHNLGPITADLLTK